MLSIREFLDQYALLGADALETLYTPALRQRCIDWVVKKWNISDDDAVGVFSDALIILVENARKGALTASDTKVATYLMRVMHIQMLKANKRRVPNGMAINQEFIGDDEGILTAILRREQYLALRSCMAKLNAKHAELVALWMEKVPYLKIASLLDMTPDSAKATFYQILKKLKSCMDKNY